jgi:hypothetical protein
MVADIGRHDIGGKFHEQVGASAKGCFRHILLLSDYPGIASVSTDPNVEFSGKAALPADQAVQRCIQNDLVPKYGVFASI